MAEVLAASGTFLTDQPQDTLFRWLKERVQIPWTTNFWAFGLVSGGELRAVVGYERDNGASCWMHVAIEHPRHATRKLLTFAFRYPFEIRGLNVVFAMVPSCNSRALALNSKLGFVTVLEAPGADPRGALVFMQMRREQCRWLGKRLRA